MKKQATSSKKQIMSKYQKSNNKFVSWNLVFVICLYLVSCFLSLAPAFADTVTLFPSHGGGALDLHDTANTIHLWDIKGQPVIGTSTNEQYTVQFGGIYTVVASAGATTPEIPPVGDTGTIKNTTIARSGSDIILSWTDQNGAAIAVDIWKLEGSGVDYSTTATWTKLATTVATTSYTITGVVPNGNNAYYRIVPTGTAQNQIHAFSNNARVVAKIEILFATNEKKLISLPLYVGSVEVALRGQVGNSKLYLYPQSGTGVGAYKYENDVLAGTSFNLYPGKGLWFENLTGSAQKIAFVGTVETFAYKAIATLDLTGNVQPYALTSAKLNAFDQDYIYPQSGTGLGAYKYLVNSSNVGSWQGTFTLGNGAGCWYEHKTGTRFWKIDLQNGASITQTQP